MTDDDDWTWDTGDLEQLVQLRDMVGRGKGGLWSCAATNPGPVVDAGKRPIAKALSHR